ncbi:hypothetical protein [Streptomyces sp. NPDC001642]|uniref:hypothetical protein n=1 Tax=Streptomyces sp. NPDC001642 TaxID=3154392 RepID=UPI00331E95BF
MVLTSSCRVSVGVLLRADHRHVPAAQFLGEVEEDHGLEVAAHEVPGPTAVADDLPPVLGGEGDVDLLPVRIAVGDVVAGRGAVGLGVRQGGQDAGVLAGGLQLDSVGQVEHHRPVGLQMPVQQHFPVVTVVGGDLLDLRVLGLEPAKPIHCGQQRTEAVRLDHQPLGQLQESGRDLIPQPLGNLGRAGLLLQALQRVQGLLRQRGGPRPGGLRGPVLVDLLEQGAVVVDRRFHDLLLLAVNLGQLLAGLLRLRSHALAEHRGQVVPGAHAGLGRQTRGQRHPLAGGVVLQGGGVLGLRLAGEVRDLRRGDPLQPLAGIPEPVHPLQVVLQLLEVRPARPARVLLERVEQRLAVQPAHIRQPQHPAPLFRGHPALDACQDLLVHPTPHRRCHRVQRGEPRYLQPGLDQLLQRDVDQVRRVVLRRRLRPRRRT